MHRGDVTRVQRPRLLTVEPPQAFCDVQEYFLMALSQPRGAHLLARQPDVAQLAREADAESEDPSSVLRGGAQAPSRLGACLARLVRFQCRLQRITGHTVQEDPSSVLREGAQAPTRLGACLARLARFQRA